jgi:hypothetical protein
LPHSVFGKYEHLIRATQFNEMKKVDFGGKDPRVELKRMKILNEN